MTHPARLLTAALSLWAAIAVTAARAGDSGPDDLARIQNPPLQGELSRLVADLGLMGMVDERRLAVALVLIDRERGYRLAMLNGDWMLYAASLPKIAILFAAMVASQEGELVIDEALEQDMHDMIRESCNPCATRVMEAVGRDRLLQILQRPEYNFYDDDQAGGLWVGKDYAAEQAHRRDPIKGLSHGANAYQVARLYYRLYRGDLLDDAHTQMMSDMLEEPALDHKFVKGLEEEEVLRMWRKSGTWRDFHSDSVMVQCAAGDYILVGLMEGASGERQLQELARAVHELVEKL